MYLFSRAVNLHGSPRKTLPWVQGITELVNANSALDVSVWTADFGQPLGTIVWNAAVESQAQLADATGPLLGHDGYLDLLEAGQEFITVPGEDALRQMVHGVPGEDYGVGAVANVTTGTANIDHIGDTLAWSVEISQHVEKLTGIPNSVWTGTYGQMGEITFIGVSENVAAAEAAENGMNSDAGYIERLHASTDLWVPGSGHVARYTRIL